MLVGMYYINLVCPIFKRLYCCHFRIRVFAFYTKNRASAIDGCTPRHPRDAVSQIVRKQIETIFGDGKQHRTLRQLKLRGLERVGLVFAMIMTAVNLRRLPKPFAECG